MKLDRHKLIRAREMLGYGVEKTAVEAGVSKNSVLRAEHEEDIRPVTARKIAAALGVPVADLLGKAQAPPSHEQPSFSGLLEEEWRPCLRSWIDFVGRTADRWEAEFDEREREWQDAEPHIRRHVKLLPNLSWATEIRGAYVDMLEATGAELDYGLYVYETAEAQELFKNTRRIQEIVERTKPWYQDKEAPRMAEVFSLQRAMAERVEEISARSSQSA